MACALHTAPSSAARHSPQIRTVVRHPEQIALANPGETSDGIGEYALISFYKKHLPRPSRTEGALARRLLDVFDPAPGTLTPQDRGQDSLLRAKSPKGAYAEPRG